MTTTITTNYNRGPMTTTNDHHLPADVSEALRALYGSLGPFTPDSLPDLLRAVVEGDKLSTIEPDDPGVALIVLRGSLLVLADVIEETLGREADEQAAAWIEPDPAPPHGIARPRTIEVELPEPGSLWYLFGNADLVVRVDWANGNLVAYRDARPEKLNREQRRLLPPTAFDVQTQPTLTFLAVAKRKED